MNKQEIRQLLEQQDYARLAQHARADFSGCMRRLVSLTYDKTDQACWRAIDAIGRICGQINRDNPSQVRTFAQKLLWMMRDESGNNPGSAPEILGEMVRNCPESLADIAPIILSFEDELMLRRGIVWAAFRIAEAAPAILDMGTDRCLAFLRDPDPYVRAFAILASGALGNAAVSDILQELRDDGSMIAMYENGQIRQKTVGMIASAVLAHLAGKQDNA